MNSNDTSPAASQCDVLIVHADVLDLDVDGSHLPDHAIAIVGQQIVDVGPSDATAQRWTPQRLIDANGMVVSPGFVDAHVHMSAYLAAGPAYVRPTEPGRFSGGSDVEAIVPFVAELTSMELPAELTATVLRPVFAAMLSCGITSVVDAGSSGLDGLVTAAAESGIRASIGPSLADRWHGDNGMIEQRADSAALLDVTREWVERNDGAGDGRIRALVSAVETIACSDELLEGIAGLGDEFDIATHIHSHITPESDAAHLAEYGRTATERLRSTGLLAPRCTVMHVGNASSDDVAAFASSGVTANHNPFGNAMFGFGGVHRGAVLAMRDAGVPIVLGSDFAGSMVTTPFDSMRAGLIVHREAAGNDHALQPEDMLAMATNPGVPIGRRGAVGRIAVGQLADLVIVDTSGPHHLGDGHPVPTLAYRARPGDVHTVIVDGRVVVDDHRVTTIDVKAATNAAQGLLASMR